MNIYLKGAGPIELGPEATIAGALGAMARVGCAASTLSLSLETETKDIHESCSGANAIVASFNKTISAKITLAMSGFTPEVLANALYSNYSATGSASSVTGEEVNGTVEVGEYAYTKRTNISALVVKDSAGTPATLVLGTNYLITDAAAGKIEFLNVTGFTQPFNLDYSYADSQRIKLLSIATVIRSLVFDGTSSVDGTRMRLVLPRVRFAPTKEFAFLGEDETTLTLEGTLLYSDIWAADSALGPFGKLEIL